MFRKSKILAILCGLIAVLVSLVWYGYGTTLPDEYRSESSGFVKKTPPPLDTWSFLTQPEHWKAMFPFMQSTERLGLANGAEPTYRIKEKFLPAYQLRLREEMAGQKIRWEIFGTPQCDGSFVEVEVTDKGSQVEIKITEILKIRSPWLRTYYELVKGYGANQKAFRKLFQDRSEP